MSSVYRKGIAQLGESGLVREVVTRTPLSRRLVDRFVAGESLDDAIRAARALNAGGLSVSLDHLGEEVRTLEEAALAREAAIDSIRAITRTRIDGNISVKATQLGLALDDEVCLENLRAILAAGVEAQSDGEVFVRIDMESSDHTESTIALVEKLWQEGHRNVGTVVQSALHRSIDDLRRLIRIGSRVRLVKGAYLEPRAIAYRSRADVDRMYLSGMKMLLRDGIYPAIATHDEAIIAATRRYAFEQGIPRNSFEFQFLYGVRRDLQQRLREEGYHVRVYVPYGDSWYPYLMRRLSERPGNLLFLAGSVVKETPFRPLTRPVGLGAGFASGVAAAIAWRSLRSR